MIQRACRLAAPIVFVAAVVLCGTAGAVDDSTPGWFEFSIPSFDDSKTMTDLSWMNTEAAGAPSERVNIGLIGCGGRSAAANAYKDYAKSEVVAVCDPVIERRQKKAKFFGDCSDYNDFRDVLPQQDRQLQIRQSDDSVSMQMNGETVWTFNHRKAEGKPYFNPLSTTNGKTFTDLRPEDHPWHRASLAEYTLAYPPVFDSLNRGQWMSLFLDTGRSVVLLAQVNSRAGKIHKTTFTGYTL
jgi:hypothetical protein